MRQLLRFAWVEAQCCLFAVLFFLGLVAAVKAREGRLYGAAHDLTVLRVPRHRRMSHF